jgi:anti-sigma-K factor RskA
MLQTQVDVYAKTTGIIVWDGQLQRGVAHLEHLPVPQPGHDYQLWIIDPKQPAPVSAGLVPISTGEAAWVEFQPVHPVTTAAKFAVSVEKTGGSVTPQGQIIFVSQ